jgi:hypothetical protein
VTTRNRAAVKRRLVQIAEHVFDGRTDARGRPVVVTYTWDGDEVKDTSFFFGLITGPSEPTAMGSEKRRQVDEFTIAGFVLSHGHQDGLAAEAAAEALLVDFEETLSRTRRLKLAGIIDDGDPASYAGIDDVYISDVNGPQHSHGLGIVQGWVEFTISCKTIIH